MELTPTADEPSTIAEGAAAPPSRRLARGAWRWLALLAVSGAVIALDQWTKHLVRVHLALGEERPLLGPLHLTHAENGGIAFGLAQGSRVPVSVLTVLAVLLIVVAFARTRGAGRALGALPYGLVLGGALSNLYDRLVAGHVVDFVALSSWPAFNVADSAITVGIVWLLILAVLRAERAAR